MASSRSDLRRWLEKQPRPASVRGFEPDGEERAIRIGTQRSKFSDAEAALAGCVRAEALDADGAILRVCDLADGEPMRSAGAGAGVGGAHTDIAQFARILADASDRAALRHADAYRLAYEQQVQLVSILSERLAGLEKAWHRLLMSLPAQGGANGGDATNESLIHQILAAHAMQGFSGGKEQ